MAISSQKTSSDPAYNWIEPGSAFEIDGGSVYVLESSCRRY